jgi:hypothetical protein
MAGRSRLARRQCARGRRSCRGRRDEDGGRWLTQGRRGKPGLCAPAAAGKAARLRRSARSRRARMGCTGPVMPAGPGTASPVWARPAAAPRWQQGAVAASPLSWPTRQRGVWHRGGQEVPKVESPLTRACHEVIEPAASAAGLDLESVKWPRVLAGPGPRREAAPRKPRAAPAGDGHRP